VGLDDDHCIVVWDWKKGTKLAESRGHKDKIFMLQWNPARTDHMITVGMKHIKFWTQAGELVSPINATTIYALCLNSPIPLSGAYSLVPCMSD